uniref:Uncharacterized protein n=1 Tax=Arundo donax TaxID=35708 RepID=A0A0A9F0M3_ARUDO
MQLKNRRL